MTNYIRDAGNSFENYGTNIDELANSNVVISADGYVAGVILNGVNLGSGGTVLVAGLISAGVAGIQLSGPSQVQVTSSGSVQGSTGIHISGSGAKTIVNNGTIFGTLFGILAGSNGTGTLDVIDNHGTITGGVYLNTSANDGARLTNTGTIARGSGTNAVTGTSGTEYISNVGDMFGNVTLGEGTNTFVNAAGGFLAGQYQGGEGNDTVRNAGLIAGDVFLSLGTNLVVNSGTIHGQISMDAGNVVNSGTIESIASVQLGSLGGTLTNTVGARIIADVEANGGSSFTVVNAGAIEGNFDLHSVLNFMNAGLVVGNISNAGANAAIFENNGKIIGHVMLGDGINLVTNFGEITQFIRTGSSNDTIVNDGTVRGKIESGAGNDTVTGSNGIDKVDAGFGNDTVDLGDGNDIFIVSASDGSDEVQGGGGVDTYNAAAATAATVVNLDDEFAFGSTIGSDTITGFENAIGGLGADSITGSNSANTLRGGGGGDWLNGGIGNDVLLGDAGADMLIGGQGRDILYGGGADGSPDRFDFNAASESGLTAATRDFIIDFQDGQDRIDVSTIDAKSHIAGDQAFTAVIGAFTVAGAQIKVTTVSGNRLVEFNTDNDVAAEFSILVKGLPILTLADFIA